MTFRDLAKLAMQEIAALGTGLNMSPEEGETCRLTANLLLEQWNIERLMVFSSRVDLLNLVIGTQSYTIGAGGVFNVPRPIALNPSNMIHTLTGLRSPIKIVTQDEWQDITEQNVSAIQVVKLYDDFAYPLSTLFCWPKPAAAAQIELYSWAQLASFATLDDVIAMPPGYPLALMYGLAAAIAPGMVGGTDPRIDSLGMEARNAIRQLNAGALPGAVVMAPGMPQVQS